MWFSLACCSHVDFIQDFPFGVPATIDCTSDRLRWTRLLHFFIPSDSGGPGRGRTRPPVGIRIAAHPFHMEAFLSAAGARQASQEPVLRAIWRVLKHEERLGGRLRGGGGAGDQYAPAACRPLDFQRSASMGTCWTCEVRCDAIISPRCHVTLTDTEHSRSTPEGQGHAQRPVKWADGTCGRSCVRHIVSGRSKSRIQLLSRGSLDRVQPRLPHHSKAPNLRISDGINGVGWCCGWYCYPEDRKSGRGCRCPGPC
jgi:hypothetical protein